MERGITMTMHLIRGMSSINTKKRKQKKSPGWATAQAKHDYDSVTHVDNSARVQLVTPDSTSILRPILEEYYERTKVPMLLNTSLNIKGQPMVDNRFDAVEFEKKYGVQVF